MRRKIVKVQAMTQTLTYLSLVALKWSQIRIELLLLT